MSDRDPDAAIEHEFERVHMVVLQSVFAPVPTGEVAAASARMVEIAAVRGDPLMWALVFARMDDFIRKGEAPPLPLLRGINDAFTRYRSGLKSLDAAFGLQRPGKGRPVGMSHRISARTQASVVAHFVAAGDSLDVAVEKAAAFPALGGVSESTVRRNYLKYR